MCSLAFAAGPIADAAPQGKGKGKGQDKVLVESKDAGQLQIALYRGAVADPEETVLAGPNGCHGQLDLNIEWDEGLDRVRLRLTGKNALFEHPQATRSDQTFHTNPHAPESKDVVDGQYRLWIIGESGPAMEFYYDKTTYELLGGGPNYFPPQDASTYVVVEFPTAYAFATEPFTVNGKGDVNKQWDFSYASPRLGEASQYSHVVIAHVPPNLCEYNQFRPHLTTLRPFVSGPVPRAAGHSWSDYLRGAVSFKVTLEPKSDAGEPPRMTSLVAYANTLKVPGLVPRGWTYDWVAGRAGVTPLIIPWSGTQQCTDVFAGFQVGQNTCVPK